jgi:TolB protein
MKKLAAIIFMTILLAASGAHARIYIPVDQPSDKKFPIAIPDLKGGGKGEEVADIIRNDMKLSGYFDVIDPSLYDDMASKDGQNITDIKFSYWAAIGAQALVKGEIASESGKIVATIRLFDPVSREMVVGKQYKLDKKDMRQMAHRFSDEIMEALTGVRGVFNTKIAFAAATSKKSKEIFVMDMDGYSPFAVTKNKSINISPSWSPDGSRLVFTSYMNNNPDLYITSVGKGGMTKITTGRCANITPAWSPKGDVIAFGSSITGITNLYTVSPSGGTMHRLTTNSSIDVAPGWSPSGTEIVFSSERAGGLHLYKTSVYGDGPQRLTFVGYQNDMPDWSPMGDKIVFAGRDMGAFDIFIMNPDGSNIQRLTIGTGNNEHPTFSPDGRYVTFSSTREGGPAIYIMRADGSNQTRVSKGGGILPAWGPRVE